MADHWINADSGDNGTGDGSAAAPYQTLAYVINTVVPDPGDVIRFQDAAAQYTWGSGLGNLPIAGIHLRGNKNDPSQTVLSFNGNSNAMIMVSGEASVKHLTIKDRVATSWQYALFALTENGCSVDIEGNWFEDIEAAARGAGDYDGGLISTRYSGSTSTAKTGTTARIVGNVFMNMRPDRTSGSYLIVFHDGIVITIANNTFILLDQPLGSTNTYVRLFNARESDNDIQFSNNVIHSSGRHADVPIWWGGSELYLTQYKNNIFYNAEAGYGITDESAELGSLILADVEPDFTDLGAGDVTPLPGGNLERTGTLA